MRCFVLIFLCIEFEVEQAGKIAAGAGSTATTTTLLVVKGDLNLAESRVGTQQVLQRLLLGRNRALPLRLFQFFGCGRHCRCGRLYVASKTVELFVGGRQIPAIHTGCQGQRLLL